MRLNTDTFTITSVVVKMHRGKVKHNKIAYDNFEMECD